MATPIDPTKPYPWPMTPPKKTVKYADIKADIKAVLANKPARDKAARDAAGPMVPFVRPAPAPAVDQAKAFSQEAKPIGEAATKPTSK